MTVALAWEIARDPETGRKFEQSGPWRVRWVTTGGVHHGRLIHDGHPTPIDFESVVLCKEAAEYAEAFLTGAKEYPTGEIGTADFIRLQTWVEGIASA